MNIDAINNHILTAQREFYIETNKKPNLIIMNKNIYDFITYKNNLMFGYEDRYLYMGMKVLIDNDFNDIKVGYYK